MHSGDTGRDEGEPSAGLRVLCGVSVRMWGRVRARRLGREAKSAVRLFLYYPLVVQTDSARSAESCLPRAPLNAKAVDCYSPPTQ